MRALTQGGNKALPFFLMGPLLPAQNAAPSADLFSPPTARRGRRLSQRARPSGGGCRYSEQEALGKRCALIKELQSWTRQPKKPTRFGKRVTSIAVPWTKKNKETKNSHSLDAPPPPRLDRLMPSKVFFFFFFAGSRKSNKRGGGEK